MTGSSGSVEPGEQETVPVAAASASSVAIEDELALLPAEERGPAAAFLAAYPP
jgi:hypothetical protein